MRYNARLRHTKKHGFLLIELTLALFLFAIFMGGVLRLSADVFGIGQAIEQRLALVQTLNNVIEGSAKGIHSSIELKPHNVQGVSTIPVYTVKARNKQQAIQVLAWCYE